MHTLFSIYTDESIATKYPMTPKQLGDTGDKGPNTHWVHGENIEITVNM